MKYNSMHPTLAVMMVVIITIIASTSAVDIRTKDLSKCVKETPCFFADPTLWYRGVVPGLHDRAIIDGRQNDLYIIINDDVIIGEFASTPGYVVQVVVPVNRTLRIVELYSNWLHFDVSGDLEVLGRNIYVDYARLKATIRSKGKAIVAPNIYFDKLIMEDESSLFHDPVINADYFETTGNTYIITTSTTTTTTSSSIVLNCIKTKINNHPGFRVGTLNSTSIAVANSHISIDKLISKNSWRFVAKVVNSTGNIWTIDFANVILNNVDLTIKNGTIKKLDLEQNLNLTLGSPIIPKHNVVIDSIGDDEKNGDEELSRTINIVGKFTTIQHINLHYTKLYVPTSSTLSVEAGMYVTKNGALHIEGTLITFGVFSSPSNWYLQNVIFNGGAWDAEYTLISNLHVKARTTVNGKLEIKNSLILDDILAVSELEMGWKSEIYANFPYFEYPPLLQIKKKWESSYIVHSSLPRQQYGKVKFASFGIDSPVHIIPTDPSFKGNLSYSKSDHEVFFNYSKISSLDSRIFYSIFIVGAGLVVIGGIVAIFCMMLNRASMVDKYNPLKQ